MQYAFIALFIYSVLITVKYFLKRVALIEAFDSHVSDRAIIADMTDQITMLEEDLRIEHLRHKAESETVRRLKEALEPANFDVPSESLPVNNAAEEIAGGFQ